MINLLKEMRQIDESLVGREIADLFHLHRAGLRTVNTLVVSNEAFKYYAENRTLDNAMIRLIVKKIQSRCFFDCEDVYVRASTPKKCKGLFDKFKIRNTEAGIKYAIEKIYRSWFEEEARAFRITKGLTEDDTIPAIIIQPYLDQVFSLVTRTPTTGELTNRAEYTYNIHNVVDSFHKSDFVFLAEIDLATRRPVKVYFVKDRGNRICGIDDEMMTDVAYLNANGEYFEAGLIDAVEYLMRLTPQMIVRTTFVPYGENAVVASGLGVAGGRRTGMLVFRTSNLHQVSRQNLVLAIDALAPDDVHLLYRCVGAIGTLDGRKSHLAVVSRDVGIPAVIVNRCKVHEDLRVLETLNRQIEEYTPLVVDGDNGAVAIATDAAPHDEFDVKASSQLRLVMRAISSLTNPTLFPKLPIDVQYHIANLKYYLRRARLIE